MQAILVGAAVAIFGVYWLLSVLVLDPPGRLTRDHLTFIEGAVASTGNAGLKPGHGTLEIWVAGQALPFRSFDGPYPGSFDPETLSQLAPGSQVRVGVVTSELKSPRTNRAQGQSFYPLVSLDVAGKAALTLEAYNLWARNNLQTALVVVPAFMCGGVYLLWAGVLARRERKPTI